ncbi:hypothetical protein K1719_042582 [Acacia pycnantha]|nr:hypothetical protein K1719_042582 [Acacia pycnantha]
MSTHSTRSQQRREAIDLNRIPPQVILEQETTQFVHQPVDLEAFDDDDVILATQSDFLEAKNNSRRHRGRTIVDVDLFDYERQAAEFPPDIRTTDYLNQEIINSDPHIGFEGSASSQEKDRKSAEPPKEHVFICPICMEPLVEEVSTKCGHIFCKSCIKAAIKAQGKCPTCRVKVTAKGLIRVFLPTPTSP